MKGKTTISLEQNNYNWKDYLDTYSKEKKKTLNIIKPEYITNKQIYENDRYFDPLLQKHNNSNIEKLKTIHEKSSLIETISKSYVKNSNFHNQYNIISHNNKIKNISNVIDTNILQDQMKDKRLYDKINRNKNYNQDARENYNILSNNSYKNQHFDNPDNRLFNEKETKNHNGKKFFQNSKQHKDFNILSGDYLEFALEKSKVDKEIQLLESAKTFNKLHQFNILTAKYADANYDANEIKKENQKVNFNIVKKIDCLPKSFKE